MVVTVSLVGLIQRKLNTVLKYSISSAVTIGIFGFDGTLYTIGGSKSFTMKGVILFLMISFSIALLGVVTSLFDSRSNFLISSIATLTLSSSLLSLSLLSSKADIDFLYIPT
jgi:hypothetical protein